MMPFLYQTRWRLEYGLDTYHYIRLDFYDYGLRFYCPTQGRFINRDSIGEAGGSNLYAFVGNDPVNRMDFLGLDDVYELPPLVVTATRLPSRTVSISMNPRRPVQLHTEGAGGGRLSRSRPSGTPSGQKEDKPDDREVPLPGTPEYEELPLVVMPPFYVVGDRYSDRTWAFYRGTPAHRSAYIEMRALWEVRFGKAWAYRKTGLKPEHFRNIHANPAVASADNGVWIATTAVALTTEAIDVAFIAYDISQNGVQGYHAAAFLPGISVKGAKGLRTVADDIIHVTPDGVAFPANPRYKIPDHLVENPYRSGSYGEIINGKFQERLRIDPATPPGTKGPQYSHYHIDGGKEHYSPRPGDKDPGFGG